MNYLKIYCNLIRKAENRTPPEDYTEKHHTFPKSIYGKNNRIVILSGREHYIAHALLERICIQRYGKNHWKTIKMTLAHNGMKGNGGYINSYLYENARIRLSINMSGKNNPFYGKLHDESTKKKMSDNGKGKKMPPRTEEYKKMLSERMKNRVVSEETKRKLSESKKGNIPWNNGKKRKTSAWNKGKTFPNKGRKYDYKLISPENDLYLTNNLQYFCKVFDEYKLNVSVLILVAQGKIKHNKKWKIEYIAKSLDSNENMIYSIK